MSDQLELLRHGIPTEVALVLVGVAALALIGIFLGLRREGVAGERILQATAGILALIGILLAGYIAWKAEIKNEIVPCRGGGSGCTVVEQSPYSHLLGVHLSILGLIGYLALLGTAVWRGDRARAAGFVMALFGFGFSLYLTYLEIWVIKAICQWCVASAVVMTMLFAVNSVRIMWHYGLDDYEEADSSAPTAGAAEPKA